MGRRPAGRDSLPPLPPLTQGGVRAPNSGRWRSPGLRMWIPGLSILSPAVAGQSPPLAGPRVSTCEVRGAEPDIRAAGDAVSGQRKQEAGAWKAMG